jgi:gamma-glutamyltranspeptidase/glutathione hydrolase
VGKVYKYIVLIVLIIQIPFARIPDAIGKDGMVVSSNQYATDVGIDVLKKGGNAVDAAIAVGFALAVVHPGAGNIGGGGFMVIRLTDGSVTTIDFRETAPVLATRDMFLDDSLNLIPNKSWNTSWASGVPGSVAGFGMAHQKYGKVSWSQLVMPSAKLAQHGFKLELLNVSYLNSPYYKQFLSNDFETKKIFTKEEPFKIGENFIQRNLASTLRRIAYQGADEFYKGKTAGLIIECMERTNGLISMQDLANYSAIERNPIEFDYRGFTVYSMPPASSGGVAIAGILNQLENVDFSQISFHSSEHIHLLSEIERRVYADRAEFLGDIDFVPVPIEEMVSQKYADDRWETIDFSLASNSLEISHGNIQFMDNESEETTHYSVVDKWGNAVSVTTTVNGWFGNGIVVDGAGFLLNNEMDDFSSKPGSPNKYGLVGNSANAIEPNKRMLSSMTPTIVEDSHGDLFLVVGSPGGSTIITTVAQVISNVIDFNMNIEEAVEQPRFHHQWLPDVIQIEPIGYSKETLNVLSEMGHQIKLRSSIGEANCIQIDSKSGLLFGSGDSRRGAIARGF